MGKRRRNKKNHPLKLDAVETDRGWRVQVCCHSRILKTLVIVCQDATYEYKWAKDGDFYTFGLKPESAEWIDFTGHHRDIPITHVSL